MNNPNGISGVTTKKDVTSRPVTPKCDNVTPPPLGGVTVTLSRSAVFRCGHPKSEQNTFTRKNGGKECRECRNADKRAYRKSRDGEIANLKAWIRWAEARLAELGAE